MDRYVRHQREGGARNRHGGARQFAKYSTEGGETEFFEDHLRTLPKTIPSAEFVDAALRRAILAGQTPEQLSSRPFHLMLAEMASTPASNAGEDDDDDDDDAHAVDIQAEALAQLRATEMGPARLSCLKAPPRDGGPSWGTMAKQNGQRACTTTLLLALGLVLTLPKNARSCPRNASRDRRPMNMAMKRIELPMS